MKCKIYSLLQSCPDTDTEGFLHAAQVSEKYEQEEQFLQHPWLAGHGPEYLHLPAQADQQYSQTSWQH